MQASQESLRVIETYRNNITQTKQRHDNFSIDLNGIPEFNGTGESAYEFIQALKIFASARNWPTGEKGADSVIEAGRAYTEQLVNALAAQTPFGRNIADAATTALEKTQGLAKPQPWQLVSYTAQAQTAAGAGGAGLGGSPALAQNSFANPILDGYAIVNGTNAPTNDLATTQTCYPRILGRFQGNVAPADGTTFAFGPINDCRRAQRLINALKTKFVGTARNWLTVFELDPVKNANFPRTLYNHRFTGQAESTDGKYGFIDLLENEFLSNTFKEEKYKELKALNFANYIPPFNRHTGRYDERRIQTFNMWYKLCMGICGMTNGFGNFINQRSEYFQKIPSDLIDIINTAEMNQPGFAFTDMEQIYRVAEAGEVKLIKQGKWINSVMPFTMQSKHNLYKIIIDLLKYHTKTRILQIQKE